MNRKTPFSLSSIPIIFFISLTLALSLSSPSPTNDTASLTLFRLHTDIYGNLRSSWTGSDACSRSWVGVNCSRNRVISLSLPFFNLRGPILSLSQLSHLRLLNLHNNRLNDSISPLTNCTKLKHLYLAGNEFSGEIPPEISSLRRLLRLDLADNNIYGEIPGELSELTHLLTLRLQKNLLSGSLPDHLLSSLVNLTELNLTNNELSGRVPDDLLKKFGAGSFSGNGRLCGPSPLPACSFAESPPEENSNQTVPSNPSSMPQTPIFNQSNRKSRKGLSRGAIIAIIIANSVALLIIISFIVAYYCAKDRSSSSVGGSERGKRSVTSEKNKVYANGGGESDGTNGTDRSKLVFLDWKKQFELEDLLRASAEMLGKGSLGTVYRAVLDDGCTVAVKRLKDANPCGRKEFEQYMDLIGKLRYQNVVRLRAYYYAKEEKLLVYDYLPNGSLHSLLHGW